MNNIIIKNNLLQSRFSWCSHQLRKKEQTNRTFRMECWEGKNRNVLWLNATVSNRTHRFTFTTSALHTHPPKLWTPVCSTTWKTGQGFGPMDKSKWAEVQHRGRVEKWHSWHGVGTEMEPDPPPLPKQCYAFSNHWGWSNRSSNWAPLWTSTNGNPNVQMYAM